LFIRVIQNVEEVLSRTSKFRSFASISLSDILSLLLLGKREDKVVESRKKNYDYWN
jgi:hypothetical protein